MLLHDDPQIRRTTLRILASAGRTDAVDRIEHAIGDEDPQVRTSAIQALAALRRADASEIMADRLRDSDPRIRSAAVASLSTGPDPLLRERASAALQEMLADSAPEVRIEAAKALAEIPEPDGSGSLVQLLYDGELEVVGQTITSIRARMERDGPNPMYIPILISLMGNRRLKLRSREALVAYGETAVRALVLFMNNEDEQIWVRRAMPKTLARLACPAAAAGLIGSLDVKDVNLRRRIIESLASLRARNTEFQFDTSTVARQIRTEAQWYLRSFADLWTISRLRETRLDGPYAHWQAAGRVPSLLQQALAQRMVMAVSDMFGLLQLIHPPRDIEAAHRSLVSGQVSPRANALEYLDNSLSGSVRRDVFAVIDDVPPDEKLLRASQGFGIVAESPEITVGRLLDSGSGADPAGVLLAFAAIYSVYADKLERYYPEVHSIATHSPEPILRETAAWVCARIDRHSAPAAAEQSHEGRGSTRGGPDMAPMAQIEKVVFLQGVDLFGSCNAEQLVQLAAIAKDRRMAAGEVIYRRNEPAVALYCLVDGEVAVTDERRGPVAAAQGDTIGVRDILSGQLRSGDATADGECRMLEIEAEDLFDLISDNIDIVRALFRQLTGTSSEGML
jgi:HEAT repeat protein